MSVFLVAKTMSSSVYVNCLHNWLSLTLYVSVSSVAKTVPIKFRYIRYPNPLFTNNTDIREIDT